MPATNFTENPLGAGLPAGWTERWRLSCTTYTVQDSPTFPGTRELKYSTNSDSTDVGGMRRVLAFDNAGVLGADQEVLCCFRHDGLLAVGHAALRLFVRGSGGIGTETGYFLTVSSSIHPNDSNHATSVHLYKYVNGVMTANLSKHYLTLDRAKRYWARVRVNGTTLQYRVWAYGAPEPTAWDATVTDASIAGGGWVGVGNFTMLTNTYFYEFAAVDGGATAQPAAGYGVVGTVAAPLVNPGGEAGSASGWTNEFGTMTVDANTWGKRTGNYGLCGTGASWRGYQRFGLAALGVTQGMLTAGAFANLHAYQRSYGTEDLTVMSGDDPGRVGIRFFDASMVEISSHYQCYTARTVWTGRPLTEVIPPNAAYVDFMLQGVYNSGGAAGAYFDDLTASISYVSSGAQYTETLDSLIASGVTVTAVQQMTEALASLANSTDSLADLQQVLESLTTAAAAITAVDDRMLMVENITIIALATASIDEIAAYLEQVVSVAIGSGSLSEVLIGQFVGQYIYVDLASARSFQDLAAARSFTDLARRRIHR